MKKVVPLDQIGERLATDKEYRLYFLLEVGRLEVSELIAWMRENCPDSMDESSWEQVCDMVELSAAKKQELEDEELDLDPEQKKLHINPAWALALAVKHPPNAAKLAYMTPRERFEQINGHGERIRALAEQILVSKLKRGYGG